jgi:hypothetical protein
MQQTSSTPRVRYKNGQLIVDVKKWMGEWAPVRECSTEADWLDKVLAEEYAAHKWKKHTDQVLDRISKRKGEILPRPVPGNGLIRRLTDQEKSEIRRLRKAGVPRDVLAIRFRCGGTSIERVVRGREKQLDAEEVQQILHLHEVEDLEPRQLAARFGVPETTIDQLLAQYEKLPHNHDAIKRSFARGGFEPLGKLSLPGPGLR